jgi:hypothetical protein
MAPLFRRVAAWPGRTLETLERRPGLVALGLAVFYLALTGVLAARRWLWNDELYTFYIARLPGLAATWDALMTGAEQLPPLVYVVTRWSHTIFGTSELATRLPAVLGFGVMTICLFRVVARRTSPLFAALAGLFPLASGAFPYAYEARPYGLVLGCAGLALLAWQAATEPERQPWALVGLGGSLAAATSLHYYAVLLVSPLAFGELVRTLRRRRVDYPVWAAFVAAAVPLAAFLPLIRSARRYAGGFWAPADWATVGGVYAFLLDPARGPLDALLVLAALAALGRVVTPGIRARETHLALPAHEAAAALGFVALPVVALVLAYPSTGVLSARYVLPTIVGFALLFGWTTDVLCGGRGLPAAALALVVGVTVLQFQADERFRISRDIADRAQTLRFLARHAQDDLPIVVASQHTFVQLAHYASPELGQRLRYLADPEAALRRFGHNAGERGVLELRRWAALDVQEYRVAIGSGLPFLVYDTQGGRGSWLLDALETDRLPTEGRAADGRRVLLLVRPRSP